MHTGLEAPAVGAVKLARAHGHLRRRAAALQLHVVVGRRPGLDGPSAHAERGDPGLQAIGEEYRQAEVVCLHQAGGPGRRPTDA